MLFITEFPSDMFIPIVRNGRINKTEFEFFLRLYVLYLMCPEQIIMKV